MIKNGFCFFCFPADVRIKRVSVGIQTEEKKDSKKTAAFDSSMYPGPKKMRDSWEIKSDAQYAVSRIKITIKNVRSGLLI